MPRAVPRRRHRTDAGGDLGVWREACDTLGIGCEAPADIGEGGAARLGAAGFLAGIVPEHPFAFRHADGGLREDRSAVIGR